MKATLPLNFSANSSKNGFGSITAESSWSDITFTLGFMTMLGPPSQRRSASNISGSNSFGGVSIFFVYFTSFFAGISENESIDPPITSTILGLLFINVTFLRICYSFKKGRSGWIRVSMPTEGVIVYRFIEVLSSLSLLWLSESF